jgi:hypothetical protein
MADEIRNYGTVTGTGEVVNRSPTAAPVPKVYAATAGGGIGGAIAVLVLGFLQRHGVDLSTEEIGAVTLLVVALVGGLSAAFAFLMGYVTPPKGWSGGSSDPVPTRTTGSGAILLALFLAAAPLVACSQGGGFQVPGTGIAVSEPVDTPRKGYVVADYAYQAALRQADEMAQAGTFDAAGRQKLREIVTQTSAAMDSAATAVKTGSGDQQAAVQAAQAALNQLIAYLQQQEAARGVKSSPRP